MPKQTGEIRITGTMGGITFYEMKGQYYARSKSSLTKRRVKKDEAFARSRVSSTDFGEVSSWCKPLYWALPASCRGGGIQQKMTGRCRTWFLEGKSEEEVRRLLRAEFGG